MASSHNAVTLILVLVLPFVACHDFVHHETQGNRLKRTVTAEWTIMVYMAADNEMERFGCKKIDDEFSVLGSTESVQVVALLDRSSSHFTADGNWKGTHIFHATRGMTARSGLSRWGNRNTGNVSTLIDFVVWSKERSPAHKYMLVFWGPGGFWHPGFLMYDETSTDSLDMNEVKDSLPLLGQIDVVAYDTSHSASVELATLWHGTADAIVFTQDEIIGTGGINYDTVIQNLNLSPMMTPEELAIVTTQSASTAASFSAVALDSRFDNLLFSLSRWSNALLRGISHFGDGISAGTMTSVANQQRYRQAFANAESFGAFSADKDLYSAVTEIRNIGYRESYGIEGETILKTGVNLQTAVEAVVIDYHSTESEQRGHGLTLYVIECPAALDDDDGHFYAELGFANSTSWPLFLSKYSSAQKCD